MAQVLARGFIDVQIEKDYKLRSASLSSDGSGSVVLSLLDNDDHVEEKYTLPLASIDIAEIAPEYALAETEFEVQQTGYTFVMDLSKPLGAAFDSQGFVIDVSHEKQAHGRIFKGHRITAANKIHVKAFSEVVDQIKMLKSRGGSSIPLQFVDQDKLEASAIEADRLGALAYGRPHAFTLLVQDGQKEVSDVPGVSSFDGELVIDDRDGELLLNLLPKLKREWLAAEKFRSLSPQERLENLKLRPISNAKSISELSEDDDQDIDDDVFIIKEKTFESMDQVDCISCLDVAERAEVISNLSLADQAIAVIELKLRGYAHDMLKHMDRIEVLSVKAALRTHAGEEALKEELPMLNADVVRLASSGLNTEGQCADFIGSLPANRGAALLRLYRLRGAAAGVIDRMRPSVLANILSQHIRCDFLRGKLLCCAAPDRRGACFQLIDRETQVRTLSEMSNQHRKELLIMSVLWGGPSLEDDLSRYESDPVKKKKTVGGKLKRGLVKASSFLQGKSLKKESETSSANQKSSNTTNGRARAATDLSSNPRSNSNTMAPFTSSERSSESKLSSNQSSGASTSASTGNSRNRAGTVNEASAGGFVVEDEEYTVEMAAQDMVAGAKAAEAAKAAHEASISRPRTLAKQGRSKSAASKLWGSMGVIEPDKSHMNNSTDENSVQDNAEKTPSNGSLSNGSSKEGPKVEPVPVVSQQPEATKPRAERRVSSADVRSLLSGSINSNPHRRSGGGSITNGLQQRGSTRRPSTLQNPLLEHTATSDGLENNNSAPPSSYEQSRASAGTMKITRKSRRLSSADVAALLRGSIHTE